MGQPYQGQGGSPGASWGPPAQGPAEPPRRSRAGLWVALGCAGLVIVLLLVAVTGGIIHLATRDGGSGTATTEPALAEHSEEYFALSYPSTWFRIEETSDDADAGQVLEIADEEIPPEEYDVYAPNSLTVYVFDGDLHAQAECEMGAIWLGTFWDVSEDPEALDPVTVGGEELVAWRVSGTHADQDAVSEIYCADIDGKVLQIVVETHGAAEISPALRTILDSWTWTTAPE
ncbi:hypothetical protein [Brachybacterium sp. YJGR34]|uniref:hypothetical protein n=1 Tax=Brachybacterium sp. YJGR34 TaxID=2059911 RepID=UPI0013001B9F|nr:hypothetical protein [Brachybacterium sp. YJGR34]